MYLRQNSTQSEISMEALKPATERGNAEMLLKEGGYEFPVSKTYYCPSNSLAMCGTIRRYTHAKIPGDIK